jgi:FkbM family methyltransferase
MATIVQIGTNNGNDHVLQLCKRIKPSFVLLVEPFPLHATKIENNYVGIPYVLEKVAITCDSSTDTVLYYHLSDGPLGKPGGKFDVTSTLPEHLVKHRYKRNELQQITVPALSINDLLKKHNLTRIDYLFIDAEGVDFDILKSLDLIHVHIEHIQIEHLHLDKQELYAFMDSCKYRPLSESLDPYGYDTLFKKR